MIDPDSGWTIDDDLEVRLLDDAPPAGFDCGREEQNEFLYRCAWRDQQDGLSVTHMFFIKGVFAGFATLALDALQLSRKERKGIHYQFVSALKLAQLGVHQRFRSQGLGRHIVAYVVETARTVGQTVGCRYVTLDAQLV